MTTIASRIPIAAAVAALLAAALPASAQEEASADVGVAPPRVPALTAVAIRAREIRLSLTATRITTTFLNDGPAAVTTLVAVALPRLDAATASVEGVVRVPAAANFIGVKVDVDGKPIEPEVQVRASILGVDVTDRLKADGLPVDPWTTPKIDEVLTGVAPDKRGFYADHGMAQWFDGGLGAFGWDVSTTLHWTQAFPAGKPVTVTTAHPSLVGTALLTAATVDRWAAGGHCLDAATETALRKALVGGGTALMQRRLHLALAVDGRDADPVESFRLVVEKPKPTTLVVACWPGAHPVTTPETAVFEAKNFTASADLDVALVDLPSAK